MRTHELKGFIFDLDGVIVNTVDLHYHAWKCIFDELGILFDRQMMDHFRGVHQRDIMLSLAEDLDEARLSLFLARKKSLYQQALLDSATEILNTPVVNLLQAAKAHGLKIGLASSSINARFVLTLVHLIDQFDAIADGTTVCRSKPAPDIFVWVAGALGISPMDAIVVEDGIAGIEAARTAGMYSVGLNVEHSSCPPHLNLTMNDLSFEMIHTHFRNQT